LQRRRAFAVAVVMAGGGEAGAGVAEGAGEDDGEGESVGSITVRSTCSAKIASISRLRCSPRLALEARR